MSRDDWTWAALSRNEIRDHGRAVVRAAMERAGFTTEPQGAVIHASRNGEQIEVHVRTLRNPVYAFWEKSRFALAAHRFAALVLFRDGRPPEAYLVPSLAWQSPNALLVSRDYEGLASAPEWGLNLSGKTLPMLDDYRISRMLTGRLTAGPAHL